MKKILIISERFAPYFTIGAIRPTKIAKYFSPWYEVTVLTSSKTGKIDETLLKDLPCVSNLHVVGSNSRDMSLDENNRTRKTEATLTASLCIRLVEKIKKYRRSVIFKPFIQLGIIWSQNSFYRKGKKKTKELSQKNFDFIFSTFSTYSSHKLARILKSMSPSATWIADYRDPVYSPGISLFLKPWAKTFARRVTGKADIITAVSKGCLDNLFLDDHPRKVVIPNGFDPNDISDIKYSMNDKFTLSYLGGLYAGKRDLSPLFSVISELISENMLDINKIKIFYAGPSKSVFASQVGKYQLLNIADINDSIPRIEALRKQLGSHLLILATWNNAGEEGVVTGKFLEYMMMNRPIIALVSGNRKGSAVKSMMLEGNLGICYEEANKATDYTLLKNYVLKQYCHFTNNESLEFYPNQDYIQKFSYKNIAQEFINLLPKQ